MEQILEDFFLISHHQHFPIIYQRRIKTWRNIELESKKNGMLKREPAMFIILCCNFNSIHLDSVLG